MNIDQETTKMQRTVDGLAELQQLVGQEVAVSNWFVVSQTLINEFAEVTADRQWIHVDPEIAKVKSPTKTTIAHGFFTLSLVSHLHGEAVRIQGDFSRGINYGFNRIRFPAPVPAGARIRLHSTLKAAEEIDGGIQCTWDLLMEIEEQSKPAFVAEWLVRLYR
jgi:acyl dehydratase